MTTSKHTPGPWYSVNHRIFRTTPQTHVLIADCRPMGDGLALETIANEKLITAAPELLSALQTIADAQLVDLGENGLGAVGIGKEDMMRIARAAIAKATL